MTQTEALKRIAAYPFSRAEELSVEQMREIAREALAQPEPSPEWMTEEEQTAYTFGWFKALESKRMAQPEQRSVSEQQEPVAAIKLLNRIERNWHRMGELWERCQGKGWPAAESDEFTTLRDEKAPSNRKALLALYTTPPQRKPLTQEQRDEIARQADANDWHDYDLIDAVEAAHGIKE